MNELPFEEKLFSQCRPLWYRIAYQYLRNPQDSQDAIQEASRKFLSSSRKWGSFEDAKYYFSAILVNTCVDFYKLSKKRGEEPLEEKGDSKDLENRWRRDLDPDQLEREENILRISVEAIAKLPPDQRVAVERLILAEKPPSLTELSQELKVPISTLKSRLTLGIEKVKNNLRKKRLL